MNLQTTWELKREIYPHTLTVYKQFVLTPTPCNSLICIDIDSQKLTWEYNFPSSEETSSQPPVVINNIIVAFWESGLSFHCLKTGDLIHQINTNTQGDNEKIDFCFYLYNDDEYLYTSSYSGDVRRVDLNTYESVIIFDKPYFASWTVLSSEGLLFLEVSKDEQFELYKIMEGSLNLIYKFTSADANTPFLFGEYFGFQEESSIKIFDAQTYSQEKVIEFADDLSLVQVSNDNLYFITSGLIKCYNKQFELLWEYDGLDYGKSSVVTTVGDLIIIDDWEGLLYFDGASGDKTILREESVFKKIFLFKEKLLFTTHKTIELGVLW